MHICVGNLTSIGSDNGLLPGQGQAIIWTDVGILSIWSLGTNFSEILIEIETFSFKKMHLTMSSGKWWTFCLCLNVLRKQVLHTYQGLTRRRSKHWVRLKLRHYKIIQKIEKIIQKQNMQQTWQSIGRTDDSRSFNKQKAYFFY